MIKRNTNIIEFLRSIIKHKLYFAIICVVAFFFGIFDASNREYKFESESKIIITQKNPHLHKYEIKKILETFLLNNDILDLIINIQLNSKNISLYNFLLENNICKNRNEIINFLNQNISIKKTSNDIFIVKFIFNDSSLSSEINNEIVRILTHELISLESEKLENLNKYYNKQSKRIKNELDSLRFTNSIFLDQNQNSISYSSILNSNYNEFEIKNKVRLLYEIEFKKLHDLKFNIKIIEKAYPPHLRISPKKKQIVFYYLLNSFIIFILFVFFKQLTYSTKKHLE